MKRALILVLAVVLVAGVSSLAVQDKRGFPLLDWPAKAKAEKPRVAILIEFGGKDDEARDWSGNHSVSGAKVVHREGYRFRAGDKLVGADRWEAGSHWGLRAPAKSAAVKKMERIATVGVVLHLEDVQPDATLTINAKQLGAKIALDEVLAGKPKELWNGQAVVRLVSTATAVAVGKTEDDFPAAAYGPDGTLWVTYVSYTLREPSRRVEQTSYKEPPKDFASLYKPGFADQVWLRSYKDGKWSEPIAITDDKQDIGRIAVAVSGDGKVWVTYSAQRGGKTEMYARHKAARLGEEQQISTFGSSNLTPALCTTK